YATPVGVHHLGPLAAYTNAISPVVFVGKTSTRPAKVGYLNFFQCFHYIHADTVLLAHLHGIAHPETIVDTAAKVFREMSIDVTTDSLFGIICIYSHGYLL